MRNLPRQLQINFRSFLSQPVLSRGGNQADALHTDAFPGPPDVRILRHDEAWRIATVGWTKLANQVKAEPVFRPEYVAVVRFAAVQPDEFIWLNELVKNALSIGKTFRDNGYPPLQNQLIKMVWPRSWIPQQVLDQVKSPAQWWDVEVYDFCALTTKGLRIYGRVCEFHPRPSRIPERVRLGSLETWQQFDGYDRAVAYLNRTGPLLRQDILPLCVARITALPQALAMAYASCRITNGHL